LKKTKDEKINKTVFFLSGLDIPMSPKLWSENSACDKLNVEGQGMARVAIKIEIANVTGTTLFEKCTEKEESKLPSP
jgi:hypothetical protein